MNNKKQKRIKERKELADRQFVMSALAERRAELARPTELRLAKGPGCAVYALAIAVILLLFCGFES